MATHMTTHIIGVDFLSELSGPSLYDLIMVGGVEAFKKDIEIHIRRVSDDQIDVIPYYKNRKLDLFTGGSTFKLLAGDTIIIAGLVTPTITIQP